MVFKNVFDSAGTGAGLFSVTTDRDKPQPGADVDFEDADDDTYDDTTTSLFTSGIHGASHRAKTVREQAPEARAILGFLASFIRTTQDSGYPGRLRPGPRIGLHGRGRSEWTSPARR